MVENVRIYHDLGYILVICEYLQHKILECIRRRAKPTDAFAPVVIFNWRYVRFYLNAMLFQCNDFETQVVQVVPRAIIRLLRFQRRTLKTSAHKNKNGHK